MDSRNVHAASRVCASKYTCACQLSIGTLMLLVAKGGIATSGFERRPLARASRILVAKGGIATSGFERRPLARASRILVAKGGIEPPTQGFSVLSQAYRRLASIITSCDILHIVSALLT